MKNTCKSVLFYLHAVFVYFQRLSTNFILATKRTVFHDIAVEIGAFVIAISFLPMHKKFSFYWSHQSLNLYKNTLKCNVSLLFAVADDSWWNYEVAPFIQGSGPCQLLQKSGFWPIYCFPISLLAFRALAQSNSFYQVSQYAITSTHV